MKLNYDKHRDVWGPLFTLQLQNWGKHVLDPALCLIEHGQLGLSSSGKKPDTFSICRKGQLFSQSGLKCELLDNDCIIDSDIRYFDMAADEYEMSVQFFKTTIVKRVFDVIQSMIPPETRILDCACGPGFEALRLAQIAYRSEVIGIDLSRDMIRNALRNAKNHEIRNVGFYQCDAASVPDGWNACFDVVFCQLSCGYFKEMPKVAQAHSKLLHARGSVILVEPCPGINNALSMDLHKSANPMFRCYYDTDSLFHFYEREGFTSFYWEEILPDIGISIMTKT